MSSSQENQRRVEPVVFYHWGKEGCRCERTTSGVRVGIAANATGGVPIGPHVFADHDNRVGPGDSLGRQLRRVGNDRNPARVRNPRCRRSILGGQRSASRRIRTVQDGQRFAHREINQFERAIARYRQVRHAHHFCRDFRRAVRRTPRHGVTATTNLRLGVDKRKRQHVTDRQVCVFDAPHVLFGDVDVQGCGLPQFAAIASRHGDGVSADGRRVP